MLITKYETLNCDCKKKANKFRVLKGNYYCGNCYTKYTREEIKKANKEMIKQNVR